MSVLSNLFGGSNERTMDISQVSTVHGVRHRMHADASHLVVMFRAGGHAKRKNTVGLQRLLCASARPLECLQKKRDVLAVEV